MVSYIEFGNGLDRTFTYDGQGRLLEIANTHATTGNVARYTYAYDYNVAAQNWTMLGQRHSVTVVAHDDANQVTGQTTYRYDANYQFLREDRPNGKWGVWTYDAIGNRASAQSELMPRPVPYNDYTYAGNPNNSSRLMSVSGHSGGPYTYDANGNRTNNATWDLANRLVQYASTTHKYDWSGRRTQAATLTYTYRGLDVVRERDTTYNKLNDFLFGPGIDEPLVRLNRLGEKDYYVVDGLGSVTALVDQTGAINEGREYDAWGNGGGTPTFGYTAREAGPPGLYYRARYYEPTDGRFISEDPLSQYLRLAGGIVYAYVLNAPTMLADPTGLACRDVVHAGTWQRTTAWEQGWFSIGTTSSTQAGANNAPPRLNQNVPVNQSPRGGVPWTLMECYWEKMLKVTYYLKRHVKIDRVCTCPDSVTPLYEYDQDRSDVAYFPTGQRDKTVGFAIAGVMRPCPNPSALGR